MESFWKNAAPRSSGANPWPSRGETRVRVRGAWKKSPSESSCACDEAFLNGMNQRWMRADFQPHVDAEIRQRIDGRRKLHRLPHSLAPILSDARRARAPLARHCAKKRNRLRLRREIGQRFFQRLGSRFHHGMMVGMVHPHQTGKDPLRLQLGSIASSETRGRPVLASEVR